MRVILGLSGGVDSAVSAYILQQQGHEVVPFFMKNWEDDPELDSGCSLEADYQSALEVCDFLQLPLEFVDFSFEYETRVFQPFIEGLKLGMTPNPDIWCNKHIKFDLFFEHAKRLGVANISTGHYARVIEQDGQYFLHQAADSQKDQTYFLYAIKPEVVAHLHFPLGAMLKPEVRALAKKIGLPNAARKDSTGICFIGPKKYTKFIQHFLKSQSGNIYNEQGEKIGEHTGLHNYTLGQRKGIGIGGLQNAQELPWFVARKDIASNSLFLVQDANHPWLMSEGMVLVEMNFFVAFADWRDASLVVRIRHRGELHLVEKTRYSAGELSLLTEAIRAVTPGQAAVIYSNGRLLAGGTIKHPLYQKSS